jgi:hypothetical protein
VVIGGALLAALGIWCLAARRVRTTIDAEGARTSSMSLVAAAAFMDASGT